MSKYQRKNLLKCTTVITGSVKVVDFDGLKFWEHTSFIVKVIFGWQPTIPEKFYIFWDAIRWAKNFAIIFDGFDTEKKAIQKFIIASAKKK